jgi:hypothetical protein
MRYRSWLPFFTPFLLLGILWVMLPVNYNPWEYGPRYDWMVTFGYAAWVLGWLAVPVYIINRGASISGKQGELRRVAIHEFWGWLLAWAAFVLIYYRFNGAQWWPE